MERNTKRMCALSERLQAIADLVQPGETIADIGTDHAKIPGYLLIESISPKVILADSKAGPLAKAKETILKAGLHVEEGDIRKGDGLAVLSEFEVSTVIIAGMGGRTIINILSADKNKTQSFSRFILQPGSHAPELREWLTKNSFTITHERLCRESRRLYEIIVAEPGDHEEVNWNDLDYEISPILFRENDRLLSFFLQIKIAETKAILEKLATAESPEAQNRRARLQERMRMLEEMVTRL